MTTQTAMTLEQIERENELANLAIYRKTEAYRRTLAEILAALRGDPVAISENWKEVERIRHREMEE
jgi:hypothetical protein